MSESILITEKLDKIFKLGESEVHALSDVNLRITKGDFISIMEPSGSGKTTLLGLLAGLDTPDEGDVIIDGCVLNDLDEDGRAQLRAGMVGFVFQNFQLLPGLTAIENVGAVATSTYHRKGIT